MEISELITILGPTATGKTALAVELALCIDGEIISADSRQVYKGMDLGTGKDLTEYRRGERIIPYHLIDILDPAKDEYSVFEFKKDFSRIAKDIEQRQKRIILCGGTGLYIDAVLRDYPFDEVPEDPELRAKLQLWTTEQLAQYILSVRHIQNRNILKNRERLIRFIEIYEYQQKYGTDRFSVKIKHSHVFGIQYPRQELLRRIRARLEQRLQAGMIEEVRNLMTNGVSTERLFSFGLEYKFITMYLLGKIDYATMVEKLYIAICQFSKRQMTWFRRMERLGIQIIWIDGTMDNSKKVALILERLKNSGKTF